MSEENGNVEGNENYLGSWKTKESAEEGLVNMQALLDNQGSEVGNLRQQVQFDQQTIKDMQSTSANNPETPSYQKEIQAVQKQIESLDPISDDYHRDLTSLLSQSNTLVAKEVQVDTLQKATKTFKDALNERDVKSAQIAFYKDNPDFNTPEMQTQIKENMINDATGMSDELVAYREIQRDIATQKAERLVAENTELKRLVELGKGTDATGKVVTKGLSPPQQKQPKTTGADFNKGMQESLNALRE